jgi:hypothetical protein
MFRAEWAEWEAQSLQKELWAGPKEAPLTADQKIIFH